MRDNRGFTVEQAAEKYDDLSPESFEAAAWAAIDDGFEVIVREPHQLLLDLDTEDQLARYENFMALQLDKCGAFEIDRWRSKSGGWHVIVWYIKDLSPTDAIAIQSMCGSDPIREYCNLRRLWNGIEEPSRLFKPPSK